MDTVSSWTRRVGDPPPELLPIYARGGDFREVGDGFLHASIELAGLSPTDDVLDLACGIGRFALPLTGFLGPDAHYRGLDVDPQLVEWCSTNITPVCPNFRFDLIDAWNGFYNPNGALPPSEVSFPYPDAAFDLVFHNSLFTHMMPIDVDHYVAETARVLRPGGRTLFSLMLIDHASMEAIHMGRARWRFPYDLTTCRVEDLTRPEATVAYLTSFIEETLERHGLVLSSVSYGSWTGRRKPQAFFGEKDLVVAQRP